MSTPGELLEALGREARARLGNGGDGRTRTYRGRSVDELVPRIQRDLGADAIIVRRREGLTGGVLGFFQHAFVEIEAMPGAPGVDLYDEQLDVPPPPPEPPPPTAVPPPPTAVPPPAARPDVSAYRATLQAPPAGVPPALDRLPPPPVPGFRSPPQLAPTPAPSPAPTPAPVPTPEPAPAASGAPAAQPFYTRKPTEPAGSAYVTAHLAALARADRSRIPAREPIERPGGGERPRDPLTWSADFQELIPSEEPETLAPPVERAPPPPAPERRVVAPGSHARARAGVSKGLQRFGIGEDFARELIDGASAHALPLAPRAGLAQAVRTTLAKRMPVAPSLPTKGAAIVVVGPGGAGKTTCCAALLGAYRKGSSLPASCATLTREERRGELRLVLSPYIMKPSAARSTRALRALRKARADGLAVIDTPTLSPSDRAGIRELAQLLSELDPERLVVALPATLGAVAAAQLLEALRPLGADALAITHADETDQIGVAVEAACRFGLAPEYMLERGRGGGWRLRQIDPTGLAEKLLQ
jgi:SRP54-type protein, GTPase domain